MHFFFFFECGRKLEYPEEINKGTWRPCKLHTGRSEHESNPIALHCETCACRKASRQPPAGLLRALPAPSSQWSHISLNFMTGLPTSQGKSVILDFPSITCQDHVVRQWATVEGGSGVGSAIILMLCLFWLQFLLEWRSFLPAAHLWWITIKGLIQDTYSNYSLSDYSPYSRLLYQVLILSTPMTLLFLLLCMPCFFHHVSSI